MSEKERNETAIRVSSIGKKILQWLMIGLLLCNSPIILAAADSPAPAKLTQKKLVVLLDWFVNPDQAPLWVAQQQGYFKQQGLDVQFIAPADPTDPPKLVAAGQADLALTYQPQLLLQVEQGLPLVRIATVIATPLNCLIVNGDSSIQQLSDLKGKRIGYSDDVVDKAMLTTLLKQAGLTLSQVQLINVHYALTQALLAHRVDAITGVGRNFELLQMTLAGHPGRAFYPEEYGMPIYDELIIVTRHDLLTDPRLPPFIRALNQAVLYLINHPQQTWQAFAKAHPELNNPLNQQAWFATLPRFSLTPAALDNSRYNDFAQYFKAQGLIKNIPPVADYAVAVSY